MAGKPKKPTSEFTKRAFDGHVQRAAQIAGVSDNFYYDMLAGRHPDYLDRGRDEHRVLCIVNPAAAADYRNLLQHDAEFIAGGARRLCEETARDMRRKLRQQTAEAENALDEKPITAATEEDLARWEREQDDVIREAQQIKAALRAERERRRVQT
jgi:hypothetical protein